MKIVKGLFGIKYMYLDSQTRVRYGLNFGKLGITYTLQRKKFFWREKAWTYPKRHEHESMEEVINYLQRHEKTVAEEKKVSKCKF